MEQFEEKLDLFLRKKMSKSEENDFISELKSDSEKMARAKIVALMAKEMKQINNESENKVLESISQIDKKVFLERIWASPQIDKFDEKVDRFLKKQLTKEDEEQLLFELKETPYLRERAKIIALAAKEIKTQAANREKEVIDAIKNQQPNSTDDSIENKEPRIYKIFYNVIPYFAAACVGAFCFWSGNKFFSTNDSKPNDSRVMRSAESESTDPIDLFKEITDLETDMPRMIAQLDSFYTIAKQNDKYLGDLQWNLAIAHMLNGNKQKAIDYLNEIVNENEEGDAIVDKAKKLLRTLE